MTGLILYKTKVSYSRYGHVGSCSMDAHSVLVLRAMLAHTHLFCIPREGLFL